jgi:hypothetical protein
VADLAKIRNEPDLLKADDTTDFSQMPDEFAKAACGASKIRKASHYAQGKAK